MFVFSVAPPPQIIDSGGLGDGPWTHQYPAAAMNVPDKIVIVGEVDTELNWGGSYNLEIDIDDQ